MKAKPVVRSHRKSYSAIYIIYNPHSTGSSKKLATNLQRALALRMPQQIVKLIATKQQGHAESLAYSLALKHRRPLIISSSGDGGYNEVINGLMRARTKGADPVAGLLPAGNANDHYHGIHSFDVADAITERQEQYVDLLCLKVDTSAQPILRYAHSYIGLGLTPEAGRALNKSQLKWLNEVWIVARVLLFLQSVKLIIDGHVRHYDSLVFSNVPKMSKILKFARQASVSDGKFEITAFRRRNKLRLITSLLIASTKGLPGSRQATRFAFQTVDVTLVQLDGEIVTLDAKRKATVRIVPLALRCIV